MVMTRVSEWLGRWLGRWLGGWGGEALSVRVLICDDPSRGSLIPAHQ